MFFEKQGPVWDTVRELTRRLSEADIDFVIIGGLALNAHHYPRQTVDVDIVLTPGDFEKFKSSFDQQIYRRTPEFPRRFVDSATDVTIDILLSGQLAGHSGKNRSVRFPDPKDAEPHDDLRTVSLAKLIELKLVTWRYKDWGDVVELIRRNQLTAAFADQLDPAVRSSFTQCWDQANDPQYGP